MHVFLTAENDGDESKYGYMKSFKTPEMLEVLNTGSWYYKIDGGNALLMYNSEMYRYDLYKRYDNKSKPNENKKKIPEGAIELPESKNPSVYSSPTLHHHYYQVYVPRTTNPKTKDEKMFSIIYDQIDKAHLQGRFNDQNGNEMSSISVELVGPNFSKTPNVPTTTIALHREQVFPKPSEEFKTAEDAYNYFETLFSNEVMEGIVVKSVDGTYYKILSAHFMKNGVSVSKWKRYNGFENMVKPPITIV